jgi:hypothetical protein
VELQQIQRVGLQIAEAALDPGGEIVAAVALDGLRRQPPAGLGRDVNRFARPFAAQPRDQPLAAPVAVDIGGVDEIDTRVDGGVQCAHRLLVVDRAPRSADRPGAETNGRDLQSAPSQRPIFHPLIM